MARVWWWWGCASPSQGPLLLPQAARRSWPPSPPLVGPLRPRLRTPYQRHAAAAGLLPRCTLVRFAGYRCVRFFCSSVAAVRCSRWSRCRGLRSLATVFARPGLWVWIFAVVTLREARSSLGVLFRSCGQIWWRFAAKKKKKICVSNEKLMFFCKFFVDHLYNYWQLWTRWFFTIKMMIFLSKMMFFTWFVQLL